MSSKYAHKPKKNHPWNTYSKYKARRVDRPHRKVKRPDTQDSLNNKET